MMLYGNPVAHSVSPAMHNAAFRALGLDGCYVARCVRPEELPAAVDELRRQHRPQPGRGAAAALAVERRTCAADGDAGNGMTRGAARELVDGEAGTWIPARRPSRGRPAAPGQPQREDTGEKDGRQPSCARHASHGGTIARVYRQVKCPWNAHTV